MHKGEVHTFSYHCRSCTRTRSRWLEILRSRVSTGSVRQAEGQSPERPSAGAPDSAAMSRQYWLQPSGRWRRQPCGVKTGGQMRVKQVQQVKMHPFALTIQEMAVGPWRSIHWSEGPAQALLIAPHLWVRQGVVGVITAAAVQLVPEHTLLHARPLGRGVAAAGALQSTAAAAGPLGPHQQLEVGAGQYALVAAALQ